MDIGFGEILVLLFIALLFFGPSKLPGLGESLGRAIRGFKGSMSGEDDEPKPPPQQPQPPQLAEKPPAPQSTAPAANEPATVDRKDPKA